MDHAMAHSETDAAARPVPTSEGGDGARRLIVLGSTGSIGVNTLAVAEHLTRAGRHPFAVVGLAAGRRGKRLAEQAERFGCRTTALASPGRASNRRDGHRHHVGQGAAEALVRETEADLVVSAIVGIAGLPATLAALEAGRDVALANKETLVAAGELVMPLARERGAALLPVDSEHSAVWQCLRQGLGSRVRGLEEGAGGSTQTPDPRPQTLKRIVLTASGGPFRTASAAAIAEATPEQALRHPTWDMGPKVTVDSATMMNKALEVIEAHHLFGLLPEKIDVLVHPQSVVHGMVEFVDGSVVAQLGPPDMRTPIQVALTWPDRAGGCSDTLDFTRLSRLDFEIPDGERFPALRLAYDVIRAGGTAGAVFNAANEAAVAAFLERRIRMGRIVELVADALDAVEVVPVRELADVLEADRRAREYVAERLEAAKVAG